MLCSFKIRKFILQYSVKKHNLKVAFSIEKKFEVIYTVYKLNMKGCPRV